MLSPQERRERDREELRTKILDAARELFAAHGYEAVTMRKIAERIAYSPTAIYLHFQDKDTLIQELCRHDFAALGLRFAELAAVRDPIERLRGAGRVYFEFAQKNPQHYRLMFMTPLPPQAPTLPTDPAGNAYLYLLEIVKEAMAAGSVRSDMPDALLVAQTIWAAAHGVISLEIAKGCESGWIEWRPIELRIQTMMDVLLAALSPGASKGTTSSAPPRQTEGEGKPGTSKRVAKKGATSAPEGAARAAARKNSKPARS